MDNFDPIWQRITEQFHLESLSAQEREEVFSWLSEKIVGQVNKTLAEMLKAEDSLRHDEILQSEGYEASLQFLQEKIPNFHYLVNSVAQRVLGELGVQL